MTFAECLSQGRIEGQIVFIQILSFKSQLIVKFGPSAFIGSNLAFGFAKELLGGVGHGLAQG
jgi:hypothetical protein